MAHKDRQKEKRIIGWKTGIKNVMNDTKRQTEKLTSRRMTEVDRETARRKTRKEQKE